MFVCVFLWWWLTSSFSVFPLPTVLTRLTTMTGRRTLYDLHGQGIDFAVIDQNPGDLVASGAGCMHFVLKPVSSFLWIARRHVHCLLTSCDIAFIVCWHRVMSRSLFVDVTQRRIRQSSANSFLSLQNGELNIAWNWRQFIANTLDLNFEQENHNTNQWLLVMLSQWLEVNYQQLLDMNMITASRFGELRELWKEECGTSKATFTTVCSLSLSLKVLSYLYQCFCWCRPLPTSRTCQLNIKSKLL